MIFKALPLARAALLSLPVESWTLDVDSRRTRTVRRTSRPTLGGNVQTVLMAFMDYTRLKAPVRDSKSAPCSVGKALSPFLRRFSGVIRFRSQAHSRSQAPA